MRRKYTQDQLAEAVKNAKSLRQVMQKLFIKEAGGNYQTIKQNIFDEGLDISHFTGKGWNKGLTFKPNPEKSLIEILVPNSRYQSHKLRKRLIKEAIFETKCSNCGLTEWLGKPIPLELEHIDGDRSNNQIENLKLLCPNCHALTATWRRRKK